MNKPRIKPGDLIIAALIVCAAAALLLYYAPRDARQGAVAVILQDNRQIGRIPLSSLKAAERIQVDTPFPLTILAETGRIRFEASACPDQVCVHSGFLSLPGQVAACVPAGVLIRLEGDQAPSDLDVILR